MLFVIFFIIFIGMMCGCGFMAYRVIKKTDPNAGFKSFDDGNVESTQDLVPFDDIRDGMLIMPHHKYRAYIKCSSVNYSLKTKTEKKSIEIAYRRFINSLNQFPVAIYLQTEVIDNTKLILDLKEQIKSTLKEYPEVKDYAEAFFEDFQNLELYMQNNKCKNKYIIVPYEEADKLEKCTDEEKLTESANELYNRCKAICDNLSSVGIQTSILTSREVAHLVYASYHKDSSNAFDEIINSDYETLIIGGMDNKYSNLLVMDKLDLILYEAETRIQSDLVANSKNATEKEKLLNCLANLEELRKVITDSKKETGGSEDDSRDI